MVDFTKLSQVGKQSNSTSLFDTFSRLDRQVSHVELRPSQHEIFKKIDRHLDQKDIVVKLNTGGGKTTTGLIYLKHMMDRYKEPVVFLVPTLQLLDQVVEEGARIGLGVAPWKSNETYPPVEAVQCNAVMVCTYDKFFNGKSTFGRSDVRLTPCALVLDDVHAGIESIRKCFSAELSEAARHKLMDLFEASVRRADPASWSKINELRVEGLLADEVLEIPHWIFSEHLEGVRKILNEYSDESPLCFAWPYLSKSLELCRLVLSGKSAAISIDPPLVDYVNHFVNAKHRLFMSASIHDGGPLIRELGCSAKAAESPVEVDGEALVGERMILVPSLVDYEFSRENVRDVAKHFITSTNVVVLVSSESAAKFWVDSGAQKAQGDQVGSIVANLKTSPKGNFVVFVNRFDGIDLPDAACRILVIDGLPMGEGIIDRLDNANSGGVVGVRGKLANKIEQGLGRAVRSNSDYCAVILAGKDLSSFVSRSVVLENFSPAVVRQIEIGRHVSKAISSEQDKVSGVIGAISQLMNRDVAWKNYYASEIQASSDISRQAADEAALKRKIAEAERYASSQAQRKNYDVAARMLNEASNFSSSDLLLRGVLKQQASKIIYFYDKVSAMDMQVSAFGDNYNLSRPPHMPAVRQRKISNQAELLASWLRGFEDLNGAVIELDELVVKLNYLNQSDVLENAIAQLGRMIGSESSRPEKECGRGPDNLWVFDSIAFCIEMKNNKKSKLWKDDSGQIFVSEEWVSKCVAGVSDVYPIIGSDVCFADAPIDFSSRVLILTSEALSEITSKFRSFLIGLIAQGPLFATDPNSIQGRLGPAGILPKQLISYLSKLK